MRALILTWTGFQDHEVIYPYYRLKGAGFEVKIAADKFGERGRFYGVFGCNMPCYYVYGAVSEMQNIIGPDAFLHHGAFDLLVLPGGVKALEKLRQYQPALDHIAKHHARGQTIASTCHGAQLLISAGIKGHTIASYPSIKDDVNNSGNTWSGDPVVVSGNIISSPHYDFLGPWMEAAIAAVK